MHPPIRYLTFFLKSPHQDRERDHHSADRSVRGDANWWAPSNLQCLMDYSSFFTQLESCKRRDLNWQQSKDWSHLTSTKCKLSILEEEMVQLQFNCWPNLLTHVDPPAIRSYVRFDFSLRGELWTKVSREHRWGAAPSKFPLQSCLYCIESAGVLHHPFGNTTSYLSSLNRITIFVKWDFFGILRQLQI
jgi:hypothetical protein